MNCLSNTWRVCTSLSTLFTMIPNIVMKLNDFEIVEKCLTCRLRSPAAR